MSQPGPRSSSRPRTDPGRDGEIFVDVNGTHSLNRPAELDGDPAATRNLFPDATFAKARTRTGNSAQRRPKTQIVGHRGFRARFPENSAVSFEQAVSAGVDGLETDVRLTRDGVVVLSHDASLKRCFNVDKDVAETTWDQMAEMWTVQDPRQPMARLTDLLELMNKPTWRHIWLMIDVKRDDDPDVLLTQVAAAIRSVRPRHQPWEDRIVVGCWTPLQLGLASRNLPGFPICHIAVSTLTASILLPVPNLGFAVHCASLCGSVVFGNFYGRLYARLSSIASRLKVWNLFLSTPPSPAPADDQLECNRTVPFLQLAHKLGRPVLAWTVNDDVRAKWCFDQSVDAIITDEPAKMVDLRRRWLDHSTLAKSDPATAGEDRLMNSKNKSLPIFSAVIAAIAATLLHGLSAFFFALAFIRSNPWSEFWDILRSLPMHLTAVDNVTVSERKTTFSAFGRNGGLFTYLVWWFGYLVGRPQTKLPEEIVVKMKVA